MLKVHPVGGAQLQEGVSIQPSSGCGLETVIEVGSPVCRGNRRRRTIELPIENYQVVSRIVRAAAGAGQQESNNPAKRVPLSAGPVMLSVAPSAMASEAQKRGSQQSLQATGCNGNRDNQQNSLPTAVPAGPVRGGGNRSSQQNSFATAATAATHTINTGTGPQKKLRSRRSSLDSTLAAQRSRNVEPCGFAERYLSRDNKPAIVRVRGEYQPTFIGRQRRSSFA